MFELSNMTERERGQGTVRWVTALSDTRAALDISDTERPFCPSGSPVLPLLPPGEGMGWFDKHRAIVMLLFEYG